MSRLRRRRYSPPPSSRFRRVAVIGSVILGILLCSFGLALAYFETPIHELVGSFVAQVQSPQERAFLVTPSAVQQDKKVGADAKSVVDTTPVANQTPVPIPSAAASDSRFAFLLMGYGGGNHDGAYLTDSMMVVIVDPNRKSLTLLSLPRDSWVPMLFDGKTAVYNKINTAYAFAEDPTVYPNRLEQYSGAHGPGTFAMDTVSRLLGIPIRYYLSLDFQGFRDMINAVGGIEVDVPDSFAARYPINDDPSINAGWKVVRFTKGPQHMDGERAIEYARARETIDNANEGTDFARSRRQRLIMQAFKNRLFQPGGLIHLPQLLAIAATHVDTNYQIPDVAKLSQLILDWKDVKIYQTALTANNYLEVGTGQDGTYLLVPSSEDHSWAQIRAFVRRLWEDPRAGIAMANTTIVVQNDTNVPGLATRTSDALAMLGYQVGTPISGPVLAHSRLDDRTDGNADPLIQQLKTDLGIDGLDVSTSSGDTSDALLLEIGEDEAHLTLSVPRDTSAPSSAVGVVKFGVWPYVPPTPTPVPHTPTPLPKPTPVREPGQPVPLPKDQVVIVPTLIGMPEAEAQRIIAQFGLLTTYVNYQTINDVPNRRYFLSIPPGYVLSQSPKPGAKVPAGTKVLLAVRKQ